MYNDSTDPYGGYDGGYSGTGDPGSGSGSGTSSGGRTLNPGGNGWWDAVAGVWRSITEPFPRTQIPT